MRPRRLLPRLAAPALVALLAIAAWPGLPAVAQGSPEPGPSFTPPTDWSMARVANAPAGVSFADVIAGGPGFIAVGGGFRDGAETPTAEIWVSTTGDSWTRVPLTGDAAVGQIRAITATDEGFIAVGGRCCPDQALVWRSADGLTWEVLPDDPVFANAAIGGVATLQSGGLVAVGCEAVMECGGGLAWRSEDGETWEGPVSLPFTAMDVAAGAGGVAAVGTTDPYGGDAAGAVSPDGVTWTPGTLDVRNASLGSAVGMDVAIIALGATRDPETLAVTGLLMGTDGTEWQSLSGAAVEGATFEDALWLGGDPASGEGGMLIGGWTQDADGAQQPGTWWSADGATWTRGTFPTSMKGGGMLVGLAAGPDGVTVAVGSMMLNRGQVPAAWVSAGAGR